MTSILLSGFFILLTSIPFLSFSQGLLMPANIYGRYGFIDTTGTWIIREKFEAANSFSDGLAATKYNGKWGFIDKKGDWIIAPQFDEAKSFSEGTACVKSGSKWGYIDHSGHWVIEPRYFAVSSYRSLLPASESSSGRER